MEQNEIKKLLHLDTVVKMNQEKIKVGVLNFNSGNVEEYDFIVDYVSKIRYSSHCHGEDDYKEQVMIAYGTIIYQSGEYYKASERLTYTAPEYLDILAKGISKGNQMSAYYSGNIQPTKKLKIKNGDSETVKEGIITKKIDYIFYTSPDLDKNYKLYICDSDGSNEQQYTFTFVNSKGGNDDQDTKTDNEDDGNNGGNSDKGSNSKKTY